MKLSIKWWVEKMVSKTFIQIPSNVDNPATLRRFLAELILRLDIAFGNRAQSPFASTSNLEDVHTTLGTVNATLDDTATTLGILRAQLGAINEEVHNLQTQIGNTTVTLNAVTGEITTLQTQLGVVNGEIATLQTQLGVVNGEIATLQTQLVTYSEGFNQSAQDDLDFPAAPTIDSSYNKAQIQQLANNVTVLANKIDSLLVVLRNAKIISV
jgi:septal ring factor EnvC (AmiA/AmiB activator)